MSIRLETTYSLFREDIEFEVLVTFNYYPGELAVHTLSNGDPGYPGTDPDVEVLSVTFLGDHFQTTDEEMANIIDWCYEKAPDILNDRIEAANADFDDIHDD